MRCRLSYYPTNIHIIAAYDNPTTPTTNPARPTARSALSKNCTTHVRRHRVTMQIAIPMAQQPRPIETNPATRRHVVHTGSIIAEPPLRLAQLRIFLCEFRATFDPTQQLRGSLPIRLVTEFHVRRHIRFNTSSVSTTATLPVKTPRSSPRSNAGTRPDRQNVLLQFLGTLQCLSGCTTWQGIPSRSASLA